MKTLSVIEVNKLLLTLDRILKLFTTVQSESKFIHFNMNIVTVFLTGHYLGLCLLHFAEGFPVVIKRHHTPLNTDNDMFSSVINESESALTNL